MKEKTLKLEDDSARLHLKPVFDDCLVVSIEQPFSEVSVLLESREMLELHTYLEELLVGRKKGVLYYKRLIETQTTELKLPDPDWDF